MNLHSLIRIERLNYVLGGALIAAAALLLSRSMALGVLVGAVLSCANFSILRRLVAALLRTAPESRSGRGLLILPKMVGLMVAVFLAIRYLPVAGEGVILGFSVFLVSIAVETVRYIFNPPASAPNEPSEPGANKS